MQRRNDGLTTLPIAMVLFNHRLTSLVIQRGTHSWKRPLLESELSKSLLKSRVNGDPNSV
jgi:hypothetical protein